MALPLKVSVSGHFDLGRSSQGVPGQPGDTRGRCLPVTASSQAALMSLGTKTRIEPPFYLVRIGLIYGPQSGGSECGPVSREVA